MKELQVGVKISGKDELSPVVSKASKNASASLGILGKKFDKNLFGPMGAGIIGGAGMAAGAIVSAGATIGAAFTGMVAGAFKLADAANKDIDSLADLSAGTGIAASELDRLNRVLKHSGVEPERAAAGFKKFSLSLAEVQNPATATGKKIGELNPELLKVLRGSKNTTDALTATLDTLAGMPAGYERTQIAQKLFGKSATSILAILAKGPEAYKEARKEAEKYGLVTDEQIAKSDAYGDAQDNMQTALQGLSRTVGVELMPALTPAIEAVSEFITLNRSAIGSAVAQIATNLGTAVKNLFTYLTENPDAIKNFMQSAVDSVNGLLTKIKDVKTFVEDMQGFLGVGPDRQAAALARAGVDIVQGQAPVEGENTVVGKTMQVAGAIKQEINRDKNVFEKYSPIGFAVSAAKAAGAGISALTDDRSAEPRVTKRIVQGGLSVASPFADFAAGEVTASAPNAAAPVTQTTPEVAGNINITFANAPAGMQVGAIETNSPNLSLGIKGDTGKNKTGSGGL